MRSSCKIRPDIETGNSKETLCYCCFKKTNNTSPCVCKAYICKKCYKKLLDKDKCTICKEDFIKQPSNYEKIYKYCNEDLPLCCRLYSVIKKYIYINYIIINRIPNCLTLCAWLKAILKLLIVLVSYTLIAYFFGYYICSNGRDFNFCWICVLTGILNVISASLLVILLLNLNKKNRYKFAILYAIFGSVSFLLGLSVTNFCEVKWINFILLIPSLPAYTCCGYKSNLMECD